MTPEATHDLVQSRGRVATFASKNRDAYPAVWGRVRLPEREWYGAVL
mgnify:CR=1 FL=1|jgi:hypothetical protein